MVCSLLACGNTVDYLVGGSGTCLQLQLLRITWAQELEANLYNIPSEAHKISCPGGSQSFLALRS